MYIQMCRNTRIKLSSSINVYHRKQVLCYFLYYVQQRQDKNKSEKSVYRGFKIVLLWGSMGGHR